VTLADGEVGKLHVGLKGIIASIYLDDLAQKTRRGQVGRVRAGRIPGGRSYGYDVVTMGEERGRRTINQGEGEIIRRIFREYVAGSSGWRLPVDSTAKELQHRVVASGMRPQSTEAGSGSMASSTTGFTSARLSSIGNGSSRIP